MINLNKHMYINFRNKTSFFFIHYTKEAASPPTKKHRNTLRNFPTQKLHRTESDSCNISANTHINVKICPDVWPLPRKAVKLATVYHPSLLCTSFENGCTFWTRATLWGFMRRHFYWTFLATPVPRERT